MERHETVPTQRNDSIPVDLRPLLAEKRLALSSPSLRWLFAECWNGNERPMRQVEQDRVARPISGGSSVLKSTTLPFPTKKKIFHGIVFPMGIAALILFAIACTGIDQPRGWSGGVISGDALIIGTEDGHVLAVDKVDGTTIWVKRLRSEDETDPAIYGTPAMAGDQVFFGEYGDDYEGALYAFDLQGQRKWSEPLNGRIIGGPVVVDGLVIAGVALGEAIQGQQGMLSAYDVETREKVWSFDTGGAIWSTPGVSDGFAYFGTLGKNIFAVSVKDGQERWRFNTGGAVVASPLIDGGRVYVGDFDSIFYALDAATGDVVWRFDGADRWYWAKAVAHEGVIFAPSLDGNLYALDANSGELRWKFETEGTIVGSPVVVGNRLAVPVAAGDDSRISIVEMNGVSREICRIGEDVRTPLVSEGDLIYFGVTDHSIRALRIKTRSGNPDEEWVYYTDRDDPRPVERAEAC